MRSEASPGHSRAEARNDCSKQNAGARRREKIEIEDRGFDARRGDDRRHLLHELVQTGDGDLRDPRPVERGAHLRRTPQEHADAQNHPRHPGAPQRCHRHRRFGDNGRGTVLRPAWRRRRHSRHRRAPGARPAGTARDSPSTRSRQRYRPATARENSKRDTAGSRTRRLPRGSAARPRSSCESRRTPRSARTAR